MIERCLLSVIAAERGSAVSTAQRHRTCHQAVVERQRAIAPTHEAAAVGSRCIGDAAVEEAVGKRHRAL